MSLADMSASACAVWNLPSLREIQIGPEVKRPGACELTGFGVSIHQLEVLLITQDQLPLGRVQVEAQDKVNAGVAYTVVHFQLAAEEVP